MNEWIIVKNEKSNYLAHYGIEKQKWGVRHGPPYPLDYEDHSKAQKKEISKYKFTSKKSQLPPKHRKNNKSIVSSNKINKRWRENGFLSEFVDDICDEYSVSKGRKLTDAFTRTVQVSNTRTGAAFYKPIEDVDFRYGEENEFNADITRGDLNVHFNNINKVGGRDNCVNCSVAAELLSKGIKGVGAPMVSKYGGNTLEVAKTYFDGFDEDKDIMSFNKIGDDIDSIISEKFGPNSSGIITGSRTKVNNQGSKVRAGGHAMHFTINEDGEVEIQDAQSHNRYSSVMEACVAEHFDTDFSGGTKFYNLTNTKPNINKMVNGGLITTGWGIINGSPTWNSFKSYKTNRDFASFDDAKKQTIKDLYEDYKQYKKENYWDELD